MFFILIIMKLAGFGLIYGVLALIWGSQFYGKIMMGFFTTWCTIIQTFTFFLCFSGVFSRVRDRLILVSWCLGWTVCFMFWAFVYPLVDRSKLAPAPLFLSTHGGLNLVMSFVFMRYELEIRNKDFYLAIIIPAFYSTFVLWPLKASGITIYPIVFDSFLGSVGVFGAGLFLICAAYKIGCYIRKPKFKLS